MFSLRKELKEKLKGSRRTAILGIGSYLRGDDALGLVFIEEIRKSLKKQKNRIPLKLFSCGTTPESFTGEIKKFKPDLILITDAMDMAKNPGTISAFEAKKNSANVSFSTHGLPIKILIDYLIQSLNCKIICIGIQPESLELTPHLIKPYSSKQGAGPGLALSPGVSKAIKEISAFIAENITKVKP